MGDYIFRNYRASDFSRFARLKVKAARSSPGRYRLSPQVIHESLEPPDYSPEQDLFLVEFSAKVVGYLDVRPEMSIGRVILDCFIVPEHRRQGLATRLFSYAAQRANAIGAKAVHVPVRQDKVVAKRLLARLGFHPVRRFHELRLDLAEFHPTMSASSFPIRHFQDGDEGKLVEIQNRSFAGTWGYSPNTVEAIKYRCSMSNTSLEGILIAYKGESPVGYCWTRKEPAEKTRADESTGQIFMLGVEPGYRNKGIGRALLLAGLAYLKGKGLRFAQLTVDSENTAAIALYRSLGFEVWDSSLWYEKRLD